MDYEILKTNLQGYKTRLKRLEDQIEKLHNKVDFLQQKIIQLEQVRKAKSFSDAPKIDSKPLSHSQYIIEPR